MEQVVIRPVKGVTDEFFFDLCQANDQLSMERDKEGNIIIMAPTGSDTGNFNFEFGFELGLWNRQSRMGYVFDSSTGFTLPDGAVRSPDLSWVRKARWEGLGKDQRSRFAPICPDFLVEIRSERDQLTDLQNKMEAYSNNGCSLGWLVDRSAKNVYIYRKGEIAEIKKGNKIILSGEDVLPGFEMVLNL